MSDKKRSGKDDEKGILGGIFDHLTSKEKGAKKKSASKPHVSKSKEKAEKTESKSEPKSKAKAEASAKPKTLDPRNELGGVLPLSDAEKAKTEKTKAKEAKEVQKRKDAADKELKDKQREATQKTGKLVKEKEELEEKIKDVAEPYYVEHPGFVSGNPATAVPPAGTTNPHLQNPDNPGLPQMAVDKSAGGNLKVGDALPGSNPGTHKPPKPGSQFP